MTAGQQVRPDVAGSRNGRLDFRSGVPDLASFPRGDWVWAMREACREVATADLDYGDPRGSGALREVAAGYLRRVRAAAADQENLVICTGFAQGLNLVLRVLNQLGVGRVAFEDPGYGDVEDDYDSEFRYDREPVGVLQGIAPDRVFTLGTVSKSLAPAIRLGWVIAPPALAGAVAEAKVLADRGTSGGALPREPRHGSATARARLRAGQRARHRGGYRRRGRPAAVGLICAMTRTWLADEPGPVQVVSPWGA